MKEFKIYLAGAMQNCKSFEEMNEWREQLSFMIGDLGDEYGVEASITNPVKYYNFKNPRHKSEREVMQFDLNRVAKSDLIIVSLSGINTSIGTSIELYEASKMNIPVLAIGSNDEMENAHPWIQCCISRHEDSIDGLLDYIGEFYFG